MTYGPKNVRAIEVRLYTFAGKSLGLTYIDGARTVICLDTSASMAAGDAWTQAKTFFLSYISGKLYLGSILLKSISDRYRTIIGPTTLLSGG